MGSHDCLIAGVIGYAFGVPGITALVAMLWKHETWRPILGSAAWLSQIICCKRWSAFYFFTATAFRLFGSVEAATAMLIAHAIFLIQIPMSALWLKYFNYGPMEWIWRHHTYRKLLGLVDARPRYSHDAERQRRHGNFIDQLRYRCYDAGQLQNQGGRRPDRPQRKLPEVFDSSLAGIMHAKPF